MVRVENYLERVQFHVAVCLDLEFVAFCLCWIMICFFLVALDRR